MTGCIYKTTDGYCELHSDGIAQAYEFGFRNGKEN